MATIDPVIVKIQADVTNLQQGLEKANAYLKGLDDNVKKADSAFAGMGTRLKQLGATIGVTFGASQLVSFLRDSVRESQQAEAAQARLRNLLLNTNGATEAQITALQKQAKALEQVGVVSADNVTVAQSQLATFDLSAAAIGKLTPAILDYVTAEKGASASADDFKQMTNSLAQALQGNFASLSRVGFVLDEATKKQISHGTEMERSEALVRVLNSTYEDMNKKIRETSEGAVQVAINDFNNLKQEIGDGLQPAVDKFAAFLSKTLFPAISNVIGFIKDNQKEIKAFAITIGIATAAWAAYQVQQKLATLTFKTFTEALKKNAFVLVVTALASLVAMLVKAYNNVQWFRDAVNATASFALRAFAAIVPMVANVGEIIGKVVTGPLRTFLAALSKLPGVGKYAKGALDIINGGLNGLSDLGTKAAAKADELARKLDNMGKIAKKSGKDVADASAGVLDFGKGRAGGGKGALTEEQKKKLDKYKDDVKSAYKDINEVIADANDKAQEALVRRNERMAEANERFKETELELTERKNSQIKEAEERLEEAKAELKERQRKAEETATKKHTEAVLAIQAEYGRRERELQRARDEKLADLEQAAQRKRQEITERGIEKLADIVEKSRARLRDAWTKGTEFSLENLFGAAKTKGGSILDAVRDQLTKTRGFQKELAALAGRDYSQTFIEQIAKAGPEAGMDMLAQLKELTPAQEAELQKLYVALEDVNQSGMNEIANTLSTSTSFATYELQQMYEATQGEITKALAEVNSELNRNVAEAKAAYSQALEEAAALRTQKLDEAQKDLNEALADAQASYNAALAEAQKAHDKAVEAAKATFDKGLAEAQKVLQKALTDAQKDYEKAIDDINASTQKKLDSLMEKLRAIAAAMNAISRGSGVGVVGGAQTFVPITPTPPATTNPSPGYGGGYAVGEEPGSGTTVNQTFNNVTADPYDVHMATLTAIRYGQAITPKPAPAVRLRTGSGGGRFEMAME